MIVDKPRIAGCNQSTNGDIPRTKTQHETNHSAGVEPSEIVVGAASYAVPTRLHRDMTKSISMTK